MLCLPAASHAQQINDSEKTAVEQVLNKCAVGVQTGRITVDSTAVAGDSLKLFASRNLTYLPIRKDSYMSIMDQVRGVLPKQLANKNITIIADRKDLKDLILRSDLKGKDKRQAFTQPKGTPLVRNLSRPYDPTHGLDGKHIAMWQSHGLYYQQGLARWEWQRGRMFQSVEDKYTQSYVLPYVIPMLQNAGAIVMTPRERDTNPYEVVVDNDANMPVKQADGTVAKDRSVYAETNGAKAWTKGEGQGFAYLRPEYKDFENPFAEGSFRVADVVTKKGQESTISWTPDMPVDREYAVYVSYKTLPNSTSDARYTVYHKDGKTEFAVNQQMGGGTWIYLGTFAFDKGTKGKVVLSNLSKDKNSVVTADAVRFGGGMGNIARTADGNLIWPNSKKDRATDPKPHATTCNGRACLTASTRPHTA